MWNRQNIKIHQRQARWSVTYVRDGGMKLVQLTNQASLFVITIILQKLLKLL